MIYFDDIPIGAFSDLGRYTFTEENIIAFAKLWDPQPFHIDPDAAKDSMFGGLVASGWHVTCAWMKLMVAEREKAAKERGAVYAGGVSPGFLDLKWRAPVRPGDTLHYTSITVEKLDLQSRPTFGILRSENIGTNQDGVKVFSFIGQAFMPRRPEGTEAS